MSEPRMIMMVGLPGSGKSTCAEYYASVHNYAIFSSDAIRKELYGDESEQQDPQKVFRILHRRIKEALLEGKNCIYDATNLTSKLRRHFLQEISNINCIKVAQVIWSDYEMCLARNKKRERKVPESAMERMLRRFEMPAKWEGFNFIKVIYTDMPNQGFAIDFYIRKMKEFDQKNPHHSLNLYEHQLQTRKYLDMEYDSTSVFLAADFHDLGKLFTQTFDEDGIAHYYSHQNVGAYYFLGLFNDYGGPKHIVAEAAALITHHMAPYFWKEDKTREKYKSLWGEDFYNKIMRLHEADEAAH